ncbi:ABC transporter ATP-binding protein [Amycolatopsis antarctica]|uniref:ABC transporter ATP-binding protein n=1 Tax=Amycolatopsis antarctica TaxID=1854586 RepID=UPI001F0AD3C6|nr:ABC transporter ATP-binding protein [Amycolatopsis antarctica]
MVADSRSVRRLLAVVPQRNNLDRSLSVRRNLLFHAAYHGVSSAERKRRVDQILDRMGLADHLKASVDTLSGGQAQRLMIARALMHRPKVLFLDEPSNALDPQARLFVHDRVAALRDEGVTVVLTTHDMDEATKLCDRVGIVDRGKLLALDTPDALTRALSDGNTVTITVGADDHAVAEISARLCEVPDVRKLEATTCGAFRLHTDADPAITLSLALNTVRDLDIAVSDVAIGRSSLDVSDDDIGLSPWTPSPATNRGNGVHQRDELGDVTCGVRR